ncbi:MAG TPA: hypothetical protein PKG52_00155 [bacterium]|nr:hypothetical protein [bacterium]HPS28766.1 hypothetical protein [bacterium]
MTEFVHANGEKNEKSGRSVFCLRKMKTKLLFFTSDICIYIMMVMTVGSMMLFDSYLKAYRNSQNVEIIKKLDINRELTFKKNEIDNRYYRMISSKELMKKAGELQLTVATSDKVLELN